MGAMDCSPDDRWLAVGDRSGMVNVYDVYNLNQAGSSSVAAVKPVKVLSNLTTGITSVKFNHDSQLLSMSSLDKSDAIRLVHLPSFSVFSNFPPPVKLLGLISEVAFSPHSGFFATGNSAGVSNLYRLLDFDEY